MSYVRKKKIQPEPEAGRDYYYQLVESRRVDGKPRQRVIAHLGKYPTVDAALEGLPREIDWLREGGFSARAVTQRECKLEQLRELRKQGKA